MISPLISVIVPCYNQGSFLKEALDSVLDQNFKNWECLIIDDGSTESIVRKTGESYQDKDCRFRYIFQENHGLPAARNKGIDLAKGNYIQFLDADDLITPKKFSKQLQVLEMTPNIDAVYSEFLHFDHDNPQRTWTSSRITLSKNIIMDFVNEWEQNLSIPVHSWLFRKESLKRWGCFDETFKYGKEDWDLYMRLAIGKANIRFHPGVYALYRQVPGIESMSKNRILNKLARKKLFKKYLRYKGLSVSYKCLLLHRYMMEFSLYRKFYKRFYFLYKFAKKITHPRNKRKN